MVSPRRGPGYTPTFDGILSSGESWVARRRASEASPKADTGAGRDVLGDHSSDSKGIEIPEEGEDDAGNRKVQTPDDAAATSGDIESPLSGGQDPSAEMSNLSINNSSSAAGSHGNPFPLTDTIDYARIEWSYKDPSGQVQGKFYPFLTQLLSPIGRSLGPFNAELMQKWFDDGYFVGDLPMKRTYLDSQWTTVDQLIKGHGGSKIFLSPPVPSLPPGLTAHPTESPQHLGLPQEQSLYSGPFQSAPLRNLRTSTLESLSNPSDSPSSSFGGGRFSNESPDPNTFGGRGVYFGTDTTGRIPSFAGIPDPSIAFTRRNTFDPSLDSSLGAHPAFANISNRGPTSDNFGYNRNYNAGQNGWNIPLDNTGPVFDGVTSRGSVEHSTFPSNVVNGAGSATNFGNPGASQDIGFSDHTFHLNQYVDRASPAQSYSPMTPFTDLQHLQHPVATPSPYEPHATVPHTNPPVSQLVNQTNHPSHSPWASEVPVPRRPGPFDAQHPTSANTVVMQHISSPWERVSEPSRPNSQPDGPSWPTPSQSVAEERWKDTPAPDSLTFSNVGQHNEQQRLAAVSKTTSTNADLVKHVHPTPISEPSALMDVPKPTPPKSKSKVSVPPAPPSAPKGVAPGSQPIPEQTPSVSASKLAWLKDDENKIKSSGSSISLREIQETEAKKAEARKAVDKERERAVRTVGQPPEAKESSSFTASWGLPTSQAGVALRVNGANKDTASTPVTSAPPVWTTAVKQNGAKKSMKEIQEEEEKRKKNAVKETAAAAARRAHAETSQKVINV